MSDILSKEKRSKIMASIKGKNTSIEVTLRKALWKGGLRGYRINTKLPGKPDIVFPKHKIVIFCDGNFWHGKDFEEWKDRLDPYWLGKIQKNMARDKLTDEKLKQDGWYVIHFWETEINKDTQKCIDFIRTIIMF